MQGQRASGGQSSRKRPRTSQKAEPAVGDAAVPTVPPLPVEPPPFPVSPETQAAWRNGGVTRLAAGVGSLAVAAFVTLVVEAMLGEAALPETSAAGFGASVNDYVGP